MKTIQLFIAMLAFIGLSAAGPQLKAVVPPPDGGYPNFTTAEGTNALKNLTTGAANTAVGWFSLFSDTVASFNTGTGAGALLFNTADGNSAFGTAALLFNTTGVENTAVGTAALLNNTNIGGNFGRDNTAVGYQALSSNTIGAFNTGDGAQVLFSNTIGAFNTATGSGALFFNTEGSNNTALGAQAGLSQNTGSGNVYIGEGMVGVAGEDDHTYIRNINTTTVSGGGTDTVTVNLATGLLGHLSSSRRYKVNIQPMDNSSETLYRLKPVTYRYKKEIDTTQSLDYGLVAEDVANVDPNLAIRDRKGQIESVRYTAINAMLLNEFLKEHRKVEKLEATVADLAAQLQKVSAQVEVNTPATRLAAEKR
jgi:Chaperone of endosialidase